MSFLPVSVYMDIEQTKADFFGAKFLHNGRPISFSADEVFRNPKMAEILHLPRGFPLVP